MASALALIVAPIGGVCPLLAGHNVPVWLARPAADKVTAGGGAWLRCRKTMNYLEIAEPGLGGAIAARNGTSLATLTLEAIGLSRYATPGRPMPESVNEDSPSTTGRSLVPMPQPAGEGVARAHAVRPLATFLAQLVAVAQGAPQTRSRRRASADHAAALYAAAGRRARPGAIKVSM